MPLVLCLARELRNTTTAWKQVNIIQTAVVRESHLMFWELVVSAVMETLIKYVPFNTQFIEQFTDKWRIEQMYLEW